MATSDTDRRLERMRKALDGREVSEIRMFGGTCFMLNGNMLAGTSRRGTLFRVGKDSDETALKRPHARPMEQAGRRAIGYVVVDEAGTRRDRDLRDWLDMALAYVETLPPKARKARTGKAGT
jgi:TfoX/Sxy family transcriptional regulator of competence genes